MSAYHSHEPAWSIRLVDFAAPRSAKPHVRRQAVVPDKVAHVRRVPTRPPFAVCSQPLSRMRTGRRAITSSLPTVGRCFSSSTTASVSSHWRPRAALAQYVPLCLCARDALVRSLSAPQTCVGQFQSADETVVAVGCESGAVYLLEDFALTKHVTLAMPATRLAAFRAPHDPSVDSLVCCSQSNVLQVFTKGDVRRTQLHPPSNSTHTLVHSASCAMSSATGSRRWRSATLTRTARRS